MRLLLIRHGETDHNAGRLALGQRDVPLNNRGRAQAQALARGLPATRYGPVDVLYASPLQRCRATADALAVALGADVTVENRLIEMDIGEVEDLSFDVVRERYPEFMRVWLSDGVGEARMPGGETLREVQKRAWPVVASMSERHAEQTVVAVTHNFVILTLLCRALDLPLSQFRRLRQDLACVSVLEITPQRSTLVALNDRCHLDGPASEAGG